jgi:hypothetical protein
VPRFVVCFILPQIKERLTVLTLILLTWKIRWAPSNTSKWQMEFNSAFKWLRSVLTFFLKHWIYMFIALYNQPWKFIYIKLIISFQVKVCIACIHKTSRQISLNSYVQKKQSNAISSNAPYIYWRVDKTKIEAINFWESKAWNKQQNNWLPNNSKSRVFYEMLISPQPVKKLRTF